MKKRIISVIPLVVVISLGCSKGGLPNAAKVSGSITYKGKDGVAKPVTAGTLMFFTKAGTYPIIIRSDGTYSASDIPFGESVVTIETESANPKNKTPEYGKGKADDEKKFKPSPRPDSAKGGGKVGAYVKIPEKYADKKTSGLTVTLDSGTHKKDWELTD